MKTIFLGLAVVLLSLTAFSQAKRNDLEIERLKGKVKSVQFSSVYLGTKDKPVNSPKRDYSSIEFYNLNGDLTEELDSERGIKYVYQFVDGFLSMKEVVVDRKKAANILRVSSFGNPEDMEKPVKSIKPDERFLTRYDTEYDGNGRPKLKRIFFSDGRMNSITHYEYNSAGLLEKEVHNSYGNKWSYFYSYDAEGNLKEKTMKRSDAKGAVDMTDRTEYGDYKFDPNGNWIERKYIYHSQNKGSATTSEGIEYRDIKYHDTEKPKVKAVSKAKKKRI